MAAIVSGRRSFGCGLVKRIRRIPGTAPTERSRSAKSGRRARDVLDAQVDPARCIEPALALVLAFVLVLASPEAGASSRLSCNVRSLP